jgi:hypothetical protein
MDSLPLNQLFDSSLTTVWGLLNVKNKEGKRNSS